jgi:hypothetical protein
VTAPTRQATRPRLGTWVPSPDGGYDLAEGPPVVELSARTMTEISTPTQPYE